MTIPTMIKEIISTPNKQTLSLASIEPNVTTVPLSESFYMSTPFWPMDIKMTRISRRQDWKR